MAELKTRPTGKSVKTFIATISDDTKRADCLKLLDLMTAVTHEAPMMWGAAIIGYGTCRYRYANGSELDWPLAAFSPRKQGLTIYILFGLGNYDSLLGELGKYTRSKSCLYIKRLADVNLTTLKKLIRTSVIDVKKHTREREIKLRQSNR